MGRKNILVKISGDALGSETLDWVKGLSRDHFVVVCVGGGTQINEAFAEAGLPVGKFGPLGRETQTFQERQLARDVLEKNQAAVQDELALRGVYASVVIPVLDIGTVLCHINGDQFVLAAYHGFDSIFVVTTIERVEEKAKLFAPYQKITVVGFPAALVGRREMIFVSRSALSPGSPHVSGRDEGGEWTLRCPRDNKKGLSATVRQAEVDACELCHGRLAKCVVPEDEQSLTNEEWKYRFGERSGR